MKGARIYLLPALKICCELALGLFHDFLNLESSPMGNVGCHVAEEGNSVSEPLHGRDVTSLTSSANTRHIATWHSCGQGIEPRAQKEMFADISG